jgi:hypothetical protein
MLSEADDTLLTSIGPGTPTGEALRRYWHPVAIIRDPARMMVELPPGRHPGIGLPEAGSERPTVAG